MQVNHLAEANLAAGYPALRAAVEGEYRTVWGRQLVAKVEDSLEDCPPDGLQGRQISLLPPVSPSLFLENPISIGFFSSQESAASPFSGWAAAALSRDAIESDGSAGFPRPFCVSIKEMERPEKIVPI